MGEPSTDKPKPRNRVATHLRHPAPKQSAISIIRLARPAHSLIGFILAYFCNDGLMSPKSPPQCSHDHTYHPIHKPTKVETPQNINASGRQPRPAPGRQLLFGGFIWVFRAFCGLVISSRSLRCKLDPEGDPGHVRHAPVHPDLQQHLPTLNKLLPDFSFRVAGGRSNCGDGQASHYNPAPPLPPFPNDVGPTSSEKITDHLS